MDKRILLGIDPTFSLATRQAINTVSELLDGVSSSYTLLLLHVIPMAHITMEHPGHPLEQYAIPPTTEQRKQAEEVLQQARHLLEEQDVLPEHVETITRIGTPPDEISRLAQERQVSMIIVGSRGNDWRQELRRMCLGSISRRVLKQARCPVMIVTPPPVLNSDELVNWYESAIKNYLREHTHELMVLTPEQAAERFLPASHKQAVPEDIQATTTALARLEQKGIVSRREYQGVVRYIND